MSSRRPGARFNRGRIAAGGTAAATPATIFAALDPLDWTWLHAGLGESATNDNGGGGSLLSAGGSNLVLDALADQNTGGAYNCSQTISARPRIETAGFNGDPCWAFRAGESQRIASTGTSFGTRLSGNDTPCVLGGVCQGFRTDATQLPFSYGGAASNHFLELVLNSTGFFARKNAGSNIDAPVGGSGSPHTNRFSWLFYTGAAGNTGTLEINGVVVANNVSFDAAAITLDVFAMGCLRRATFVTFTDGRIRTFFGAAGSAAVVAGNISALRTWLATFLASKTRSQVSAAGDSITHTANGENSFMVQWAAAMPGTDFINDGVPGAIFSDVDTTDPRLLYRYAHSNYDAGRAANVFRLGWGLNDILTGVSAATLSTKYQAAITAIKTAYPSAGVIIPTLFDCTSFTGPMQTQRGIWNTDARANAVSWGAVLHDQEAITPEVATDPAIFSDGKHQTETAQGYQVAGRNGSPGLTAIAVSLGCVV